MLASWASAAPLTTISRSHVLRTFVESHLSPRADDGCNMNPDTPLMQCLGDYASVPPTSPSAGVTPASMDGGAAEATWFCGLYQQLADCWSYGNHCLEWLPMQIEADKFCALASQADSVPATAVPTSSPPPLSSANTSSTILPTLPTSTLNFTSILPPPSSSGIGSASIIPSTISSSSSFSGAATLDVVESTSAGTIPSGTMASVIAEASEVVSSIWHDNSGTQIPAPPPFPFSPFSEPKWTSAPRPTLTFPGQGVASPPNPSSLNTVVGGIDRAAGPVHSGSEGISWASTSGTAASAGATSSAQIAGASSHRARMGTALSGFVFAIAVGAIP